MSYNISLHQLRIFSAVIKNGNYTRAAKDLGLTQPAVSMQMKQLENMVQATLVDVVAKRLYPTEVGQTILDHARTMLDEFENMENALDALKGLQKGRLRLSTVTTVNYFVPTLLRTFHERLDGITVTVDVANRQDLLGKLADNDVDMVIMGRPPEDADLVAYPFLENPLVIIAPPDHPLVQTCQISLEELAEQTFLMREAGSGTRGAMERFFAANDLKITTSIEVSGADALKQGVQAGLGLALMSRDAVDLELQMGRLAALDVEGFPIPRHWYLVHRTGKRLSAPAEAFKAFVLKDSAQLLGRRQLKTSPQ